MSMNSESLPQNNALFSSDLFVMFLIAEICANDLDTFVRNKVYDLEEGAEMSSMAPSLAVKNGRRMMYECWEVAANFPTPQSSHCRTWVTAELAAGVSRTSKQAQSGCVVQGGSDGGDHPRP